MQILENECWSYEMKCLLIHEEQIQGPGKRSREEQELSAGTGGKAEHWVTVILKI